MKFIKSKKALVLLASLAVIAISAVGAYAYFTSTGTGTGTASVGSSTNWVVAQDAYDLTTYPQVTLTPGQGTQPLQGAVKNNGSANQQLNTITATIEAPTLASGHSGPNPCTAADYALTAPSGWVVAADGLSAVKTLNQDVIAGATVAFSGLSVSMIDRHDVAAGDNSGNQNDCQGATINLKYDAA